MYIAVIYDGCAGIRPQSDTDALTMRFEFCSTCRHNVPPELDRVKILKPLIMIAKSGVVRQHPNTILYWVDAFLFETSEANNLPNDFPVAIIEHSSGGTVEYSNEAFEDLFYGNQTNDPFRCGKSADYTIATLRGEGETGEITNEDRENFGRVDYFIRWDDHSLSFKDVIKLGYPRTEGMEEGCEAFEAARKESFKDERFFRFWTKERSARNAAGERVFISAIIELTLSERQRRDMRKVEERFAEKLSKVLIDERLIEQDIFELRNRPKSGEGAASGDFFFFWRVEMERTFAWIPLSERRRAVIFIGDSSAKELLAAASVQQTASILVPTCKSPPNMFFDEPNPGKFLLQRLNSQFISSRVMGDDRIDGVVLVFDLATRVLHFAGGHPGAILLIDEKNGEVSTLTDEVEETFGPPIGVELDTPFVSGSTRPLPPETIILGLTDGARFRIAREATTDGSERSFRDIVGETVKTAFKSARNSQEKAKNRSNADCDEDDSLLKWIVASLSSHTEDETRIDDELVVAISLKKLLNQE